jgi:hypothetical protein
MDVDAALERLGLDRTVDIDRVKQHFRRLAHDHHPDRGGDSAHFAELNLAYRVLLEHHEPRPAPPRVAQGRPSREPTLTEHAPDTATLTAEPLDRDELTRLRTSGRRIRADAALLSRLLVTDPPAGTPARLRPLLLLSRAPGARSNGLAALLSEGSSSELRLCDRRDRSHDDGEPGGPALGDATIVLLARGRAARRAVDGLELDLRRLGANWRRERGDTSVRLRTTVTSGDTADRAVRVAHLADTLLCALAWPLEGWSLDVASLGGRPAA